MSYDFTSQVAQAANDALEAGDADGAESPEGDLGDGAAFGKFCLQDGKFKRSCQNCTGFTCNLARW